MIFLPMKLRKVFENDVVPDTMIEAATHNSQTQLRGIQWVYDALIKGNCTPTSVWHLTECNSNTSYLKNKNL